MDSGMDVLRGKLKITLDAIPLATWWLIWREGNQEFFKQEKILKICLWIIRHLLKFSGNLFANLL
uniref:Uncharacterized protein n=1 Tax=Rhizophora mucronata TaxID=61149 RepID=A0A2P2R364_RHIMU